MAVCLLTDRKTLLREEPSLGELIKSISSCNRGDVVAKIKKLSLASTLELSECKARNSGDIKKKGRIPSSSHTVLPPLGCERRDKNASLTARGSVSSTPSRKSSFTFALDDCKVVLDGDLTTEKSNQWVFLNRYGLDIQNQIGCGSYGTVYAVNDTRLQQKFAIKIMYTAKQEQESKTNAGDDAAESSMTSQKPRATRSAIWQRELGVMQFIRNKGGHPNLLIFENAFVSPKCVAFVFELMPLGDVQQILIRNGAMSESETRGIAKQVLSSLKFLHSLGIVHRDVKGSNVLLSLKSDTLIEIGTECNFVAKLTDFGLAREFSRDTYLDSHAGSPHYAAPEVHCGGKYHGPEADIWSVGVLVYTMLAVRFPFDGSSLRTLRSDIFKSEWQVPAKISKSAIHFMHHCMRKNACDRRSVEVLESLAFLNPEISDSQLTCCNADDLDAHIYPTPASSVNLRDDKTMASNQRGSRCTSPRTSPKTEVSIQIKKNAQSCRDISVDLNKTGDPQRADVLSKIDLNPAAAVPKAAAVLQCSELHMIEAAEQSLIYSTDVSTLNEADANAVSAKNQSWASVSRNPGTDAKKRIRMLRMIRQRAAIFSILIVVGVVITKFAF